MKKLLSLVLAVAMLLSLCACGSKEATSNPGATDDESGIAPLNITFNVAVSGEMYDAMTNKFAERCKELSDGAITVQTVAAGTLGSAREVVEACQLNSVNMIWAADSELDQVVGNLSWAWLPYTVTNYEQADEYYNEGWIDEAIAEICAEAGITCVAGSENGTRIMCTKGVIVDSIDKMKGLKVRVPEQAPLVRFYSLCGSLPSTITASESFSAMQQGTVDGSDNTLVNLNNLGFFDIVDCITALNYQYSSAKICANKAWYDALSDAQREVIEQAAAEAGLLLRDWIRDNEAQLFEKAESMNITVVNPDEAFQAELKKAASVMWEEAYGDYPEEYHHYIDKMIETFGN